MPETPEEFWQRVHDGLSVPPVEEWDSWPFDGTLTVRPLQPPVEREKPRHGEGAVDCLACNAPDKDYVWTTERRRPPPQPSASNPPRPPDAPARVVRSS